MKALLLSFFFIAAFAAECAEGTSHWSFWDGEESIERYAKRVELPPTQMLDLGNGVKLELVLVPAGQFIMGTPAPEKPIEDVAVGQIIMATGGVISLVLIMMMAVHAIRKRQRPRYSLLWLLIFSLSLGLAIYGCVRWQKMIQIWREYQAAIVRYDSALPAEKPSHSVKLTTPFYLGKFLVTQEQYQQVMGANPSRFEGNENPVETLMWGDAQDFCERLGRLANRTVRLPTEAEWEYACRAGTNTVYNTGDSESDLARAGWYINNINGATHSAVGIKTPNQWGLYDMHGNVWEWCHDWYAEYVAEMACDPQGPEQGTYRVLRGGSYKCLPEECRSASRSSNFPGFRGRSFIGFRVEMCATPDPPKDK